MLNLELSPAALEILPQRDAVTMEVVGFGEAPVARGSLSSSSALTRRLAARSDFVFGSSNGVPFLPGGLDADPAAAPRAPAPTDVVDAGAASAAATVVDFTRDLLSVPPGFARGATYELPVATQDIQTPAPAPPAPVADVTPSPGAVVSIATLLASDGIVLEDAPVPKVLDTSHALVSCRSCAGPMLDAAPPCSVCQCPHFSQAPSAAANIPTIVPATGLSADDSALEAALSTPSPVAREQSVSVVSLRRSHSCLAVYFKTLSLEMSSGHMILQNKSYAINVDVSQPVTNFSQQVPNPAITYPFELDVFQKQVRGLGTVSCCPADMI